MITWLIYSKPTFGPRSNYPKTHFRSSRRDESELKWVYKWVFEAFINHMIMIIRKHFWSTFISPTGPKVSFRINKSRDHLFRREIGRPTVSWHAHGSRDYLLQISELDQKLDTRVTGRVSIFIKYLSNWAQNRQDKEWDYGSWTKNWRNDQLLSHPTATKETIDYKWS